MDEELTSKNFLRFITRRGLSRDRPDSNPDRQTSSAQSSKASSSAQIDPSSANRRSSLVYAPRPNSISPDHHHPNRPTRMSDTFAGHRSRPSAVAPSSTHPSQRPTSSSYHNQPSSSSTHPTQLENRLSRTPAHTSDDQPNKKFYQCEYCGLTFGRKHHKERHVANIHRHVRFSCHFVFLSIFSPHFYSLFSFSRPYLFQVPTRTRLSIIKNANLFLLHTQEKPYVCDLCGHRFHQKPNLDRHRATVHADVSPFRCDQCGANFARRNLLKTHVQTMHERPRRHECSICHVVLREAQQLSEHMRLEHSSPVTQLSHSRPTR